MTDAAGSHEDDDSVLARIAGTGSRKRRIKNKTHRKPRPWVDLALAWQPLDWPCQQQRGGLPASSVQQEEEEVSVQQDEVLVQQKQQQQQCKEHLVADQDYVHTDGAVRCSNEAARRYSARAALQVLRGQADAAVKAADAALATRLAASSRVAVMETRAAALLLAGHADEALAAAADVLEQPLAAYESPAQQWGEAASARGAPLAALRAAQYVCIHHGASLPAWLRLAQCYAALGRRRCARQALVQLEARLDRLNSREKVSWLTMPSVDWSSRMAGVRQALCDGDEGDGDGGDGDGDVEEIPLPARFAGVDEVMFQARHLFQVACVQDDQEDEQQLSGRSVLDL